MSRMTSSLPLLRSQTQIIPVEVDISKRFAVVNSKHAEEPFPCSHVLVTHGTVLLLPCRVQDVQQARLAIDNHLLSVRILQDTAANFRLNNMLLLSISGIIKEK